MQVFVTVVLPGADGAAMRPANAAADSASALAGHQHRRGLRVGLTPRSTSAGTCSVPANTGYLVGGNATPSTRIDFATPPAVMVTITSPNSRSLRTQEVGKVTVRMTPPSTTSVSSLTAVHA